MMRQGLRHRLMTSVRGRARGEQGFTMVEVMTAGAILSVVAVSLMQCWAVFDRMSFDLLLRQKAVFVLNGEMERLWSVYTSTSFGAGDYTRNDYPAVPGLPSSNIRISYPSISLITDAFTTASTSNFVSQATSGPQVFLGTGSPPLNWVWLDVSRNLVARLSWRTCTFKLPDLQSCWGYASGSGGGKGTSTPSCFSYSGAGNGVCEMITAILEFPYNFSGGSPQAVGTTRTLTLSTVVGRRS